MNPLITPRREMRSLLFMPLHFQAGLLTCSLCAVPLFLSREKEEGACFSEQHVTHNILVSERAKEDQRVDGGQNSGQKTCW